MYGITIAVVFKLKNSRPEVKTIHLYSSATPLRIVKKDTFCAQILYIYIGPYLGDKCPLLHRAAILY